MVSVEVVTQPRLVMKSRPTRPYGCKGMDVILVLADVQLLIQVLVVAPVPPVERHVGKSLQSTRAVLHGQVVVAAPVVVTL